MANATKWLEMAGKHSSGKCLPELQWILEWHRFLDDSPCERWFPVAITMKWSSRTLVDSRPLEVCAYREEVLTHTRVATFLDS